jgi:hypothetical protein
MSRSVRGGALIISSGIKSSERNESRAERSRGMAAAGEAKHIQQVKFDK